MKKIILLLLFLPLIASGQFIKKDKQLHLLAGAGTGGLAHSIAMNENVHPLLPTVGFATFMGVMKETMDYFTYGVFDFGDLTYTALGGLVTFSVLELLGRDAGSGLFLSFGSGIALFVLF